MPAIHSPGRTGAMAEEQARSYLEAHGLTLAERNYRCRQGEIDLIMQDQDTLVFVEVRYRSHSGFGGAGGSITAAKQHRITLAANHFLQSKKWRTPPPCRFDVLAIEGKAPQNIHWIKDAFQASP